MILIKILEAEEVEQEACDQASSEPSPSSSARMEWTIRVACIASTLTLSKAGNILPWEIIALLPPLGAYRKETPGLLKLF